MILHLHTDSRFTDYAIELFSDSEVPHTHLVGIRYPGQKLKAVKLGDQVETFVFGYHSASKLIRRIKPSLVVVHFFDKRWIDLIHSLPTEVKVLWIFWGGDGYSLPKMAASNLDQFTNKWMESAGKTSGISKLKADLGMSSIWNIGFMASLAFEFIRRLTSKKLTLEEAFQRINYCGTFLKEDYELLVERYPFEMNWMDACFISIDRLLSDQSNGTPLGNNLLLGNSATLENNHLDAFELLKQLDFDQKIIAPLNYGKDLGDYQQVVVAEGKRVFGTRFSPVTEPLSLKEYNDLLATCSVAIMFHNRQQAFNNILTLLYLGIKVYLKPENTIYQFLNRHGIHVFNVNDLKDANDLMPLDKELQEVNRQLVRALFGKKRINETVNRIESLAQKK